MNGRAPSNARGTKSGKSAGMNPGMNAGTTAAADRKPPRLGSGQSRGAALGRKVLGRGAASAPIVPAASVPGRALTLVVAIMSYLACLTIGAVTVVQGAATDWSRDLTREVTIQVRPVDGVDMGEALDRASSIASAAPGIGTVQVLSNDETRALLQPWLGSGLDLDALPVPRLISVQVADPAKADLAALGAEIAQRVKGASLDDHSAWSAHMAAMAASVVAGGLIVLALVMTAMMLCVVFATRAAMAANREVVEVLHFVGAESRFIAREFQRHFWRLGLRGGLFGGAMAVVTYLAIGFADRNGAGTPEADQAHALFGSLSVGWLGYLATVLVAAFAAFLAAATSRLAVQGHLSRLS